MKISKKGSKSSYVIGFFAASLSIITVISAMLLSIPVTNAETTTSNASISVGMSCSMAVTPGTGGTATSDGYSYSATVTPGVPSEISGSILTTTCNGPGNYSLYAIGYSGDSYDTPTNTQMISSTGTNNIATGTATSGGTSNWAFKLASVSGTSAPTIVSPYSNYSNVPGDNFAKVATMLGSTGLASTSAVQAKYQVYASTTQTAGAYTGKVKYTFVYPNDAPAPSTKLPLYDTVASMSKGTQTLAELRTAIDVSNSGVYEYDSSIFGTASDATNTSKIYYYRGILDNTVGTRGSDGDNAAWPNTVVLSSASNKSGLTTSDTCWRIVRTTGSGGVKMIYQGKWTGSTCANSSASANAVSSVYFNRRSTSSTDLYDTKGRIIYVGYNFSNNSSHQTGTSSVNNTDLFVNGTKSNLRTLLESWYNSNMTTWTSKLETSAGWCNDRTTYSSDTTSSKTTSNIPYKTSSATVNFGAYIRNATTDSQPTLGCPNDTGYDLLTTSNGYIGVPSAPLTADEAAFAGSGKDSSSTPYHANSFLRSGDNFWLLSPYYRGSSGNVCEFYLGSSGSLNWGRVSDSTGVRPSISLTSGTMATSGTGTAADPWIVNP